MIALPNAFRVYCKDCGLMLDGRNRTYCKKCAIVQTKRWQQDNPDKRLEWLRNNPDSRRATQRKSQLKFKYGLTPEDVDAMYEAQGGRCAACGDLFRKNPDIDHDHDTGAVRALLCMPCNRALGMCFDDPRRLRLLADYIERFR